MSALTFGLVQTSTLWHDPAGNRARFESILDGSPDGVDVVVLPEMFATGFTMDSQTQAEPADGGSLLWLKQQAVARKQVLCGSLSIRDGERCVNRFVWAEPDGAVTCYDKRHRFRMAGEHEHYAAGVERVVISYRGLRILPFVCYDLRFPVWLRNSATLDGDYDMLLGVANWPAARQLAWQTLLRARAIENLAACVAVNIIGRDGNDVAYAGGSAAFGPDGEQWLDAGEADGVFLVEVDTAMVRGFRQRFPAWQDSDSFDVLSTPDRRT